MQTKGLFLWPETIAFLTVKSKNIRVMYNDEIWWAVFDLLVIWYWILSETNSSIIRYFPQPASLIKIIWSIIESDYILLDLFDNLQFKHFCKIGTAFFHWVKPKHTDAQRLNWRVFHKASVATGLKIKPGKVILIPYWSHSLISHLAFAFPSA